LHLADHWAGGEASIVGATASQNPRMIKSSTASNGTSVTLTLYYPIDVNIAVGVGVYCCQSPYAVFQEAVGGASAGPMIGYTWTPVTALNFMWIQTWGLAQGVFTGTTTPAAGERDLVFNSVDGTLLNKVAAYTAQQFAGRLESALGDQYMTLMLDP